MAAVDLVVAAAEEEAVVVAVPHRVRRHLALRVHLALLVVAEEAAELPD